MKFKNPDVTATIAVFIGGMIGGTLRYYAGELISSNSLLNTTIINLIGSFVLAWLTFYLANVIDLPNWLITGLGTGICGAFTTFSTLMKAVVDTANINLVTAGIGLIINLGGGLLMAWLAFNLYQHRSQREVS